ncbi:MAG TPA: hypothetical protein VGQ95_04565 [Chthoniobacterales bacterium]|nr:hypothetical protein [Chthoniobacterales bacterium]
MGVLHESVDLKVTQLSYVRKVSMWKDRALNLPFGLSVFGNTHYYTSNGICLREKRRRDHFLPKTILVCMQTMTHFYQSIVKRLVPL